MINACDLRNKNNVLKIEDKPGYYKWWATREDLDFILDKLSVRFEDIQSGLEIRGGLYAVYVGISVKESVRNRLNWHVNDAHTASQVEHGTLSTLRQSIASIVSGDQYDKDSTNTFIDRLKVEYFVSDNPIKSDAAKEELHGIERELLSTHLYVLNIQENNHPLAAYTKRKLSQLRMMSKRRRYRGGKSV